MKKYPLIIDCDPGIDDVLAVLVAHSKPEFDIKAICSVSGNVGIDLTTHNARLMAGLLGLDCIIAKGAEKPLIKNVLPATEVHGLDGFGGYSSTFSDDKLSKLSDLSAIEVQRKILMESNEPVYIAATGPLTNIALLLSVHPEVKSKIAAISIMGGGINIGNATPFSEFNYFTDPEAAYIVFNSGVKLMMCGLNVTLKATLTDMELNKMREFHNTISDITVKILSSYAANDAGIHDPCAILAISDTDMFEYKDQYVQIDTRAGITQGMSYVDEIHNLDKKPNCRVFYDIDRESFRKAIVKAINI
ncbi:nucleoside hydrolase [Clostridium sp. P21]|uniref:Nucleoside hydrolase n=1 Tax=Clostridium muellerianum TaxID=2716538 RepID=A0A7Y0EK68_9CLOT|nr:nucleoside hydrolase [Clostridium muellerianum]NMM63940.1 nucleoside hydrolase [Clostridium muellerianum]